MYINYDLGLEWWLPPRTASRMTKEIITPLGFELIEHHHFFSDASSQRKIILNVRNPYSIIVSRYKQFYKRNIGTDYGYDWESFKSFVITYEQWINDAKAYKFYTYPQLLESQNRKPDFVIRYENFKNDLMSLSFIRNNTHLIQSQLDKLDEGKWVENSSFDTTIPYHTHYDQETADIVYKIYEHVFIFDGYERDSWKYITI